MVGWEGHRGLRIPSLAHVSSMYVTSAVSAAVHRHLESGGLFKEVLRGKN